MTCFKTLVVIPAGHEVRRLVESRRIQRWGEGGIYVRLRNSDEGKGHNHKDTNTLNESVPVLKANLYIIHQDSTPEQSKPKMP